MALFNAFVVARIQGRLPQLERAAVIAVTIPVAATAISTTIIVLIPIRVSVPVAISIVTIVTVVTLYTHFSVVAAFKR